MTFLIILICIIVAAAIIFAITKRLLNYIYESALKRGNRKKAFFYGGLYYKTLTSAERESERIDDIKEAIEKDLTTYKFSIPEY